MRGDDAIHFQRDHQHDPDQTQAEKGQCGAAIEQQPCKTDDAGIN